MHFDPEPFRPLIHPLGWSLLHSLWECAAVALVLAVGLRLLRASSAQTRYVVACAALVIAAACPLITFGYLFREPGTAQVVVAGSPTAIDAALPWLVAAWFLGVLLLTLRLASGWTAVRRLRREGTDPLDGWLAERARELVVRLGIRGPVEFLTSSRAEVPSVCGVLRCTVLIPVSALTGIALPELEALLAHELAHVRRYDLVVNLIQVTIETVLFYHPAIRWISERIRIERENCCDDLAVAVLGDRVRYVRALVSLEELRVRPHALALAGNGGSLPARVRRLLGLPAENTEMNAPWMAAVLSACLLLPVATLATTNPPTPPAAPVPARPLEPAIAPPVPAPAIPPVVSIAPAPPAPRAVAPTPRVAPAGPALTPVRPPHSLSLGPVPQAVPAPPALPLSPMLGIAPPGVGLPAPRVPATPSAVPPAPLATKAAPQPVRPAGPSLAPAPSGLGLTPPSASAPSVAPVRPNGPLSPRPVLPGSRAVPGMLRSAPPVPPQPRLASPVPTAPIGTPATPSAAPQPVPPGTGALRAPVPDSVPRQAPAGSAPVATPIAPATRAPRPSRQSTPRGVRPAARPSRGPTLPAPSGSATPVPAPRTVAPPEEEAPNAPQSDPQQESQPQQRQLLQPAPSSAADQAPQPPPPAPAVPQP